MDFESFTYTEIPQGGFFRLLKIYPGSADDPLVCDLFVAEIDTAPPYTALSYVWGDPTKSAEIICSDHVCHIGQSLSDGLRRMRDADEDRIAWADAICINQNDNVEKGHQVDLMGVIYDKARDVLVWLGPDTTGSAEEAFRCIRTINKKIYTKTDMEEFIPTKEEMPWTYLAMKPEGASEYTDITGNRYGRRSTLPSVLGANGKDCIGKLFNLTWFSRVWILQEVGLATAATAFWGDSSIDFAEIAEFIYNTNFQDEIKFLLGPENAARLGGAPLYGLWNVWATYEKEGNWMYRNPTLRGFHDELASHCDFDFMLVMEASRYFNATNKLDHVYAFLGHPKAKRPGTDRTWLQANYSLSVKEQHRLLAVNIAQHSLNFLVQAHQTEESLKPGYEHPSWIPQWDRKMPSHADAFWEAWDATLRKAEQKLFKAQADGNKLTVSGYVIDHIGQFTRVMETADFDSPNGSGHLIDVCWEVAQQKPSPYPKEKTNEAFASTLVCYYDSKGDQAGDGRNRVVEQFAGYCLRANEAFYAAHLKPGYGFWSLDTIIRAGYMFDPAFKSYGTNRRFFNTASHGFWGLGPKAMQKGDVCVLLFGADVPFVLRPTETTGEFKVVGQCYMYKFMDGEAIKQWRDRNHPQEDFVLV
ncbi:hypothetical protein NW759_016358 [Fusarium solani]|nr:hypothetical protein NW759_016358 [Fusarium solani]